MRKVATLSANAETSSTLTSLHEYHVLPDTREIFFHRHVHNESSETEDDVGGIDYRSTVSFIKNLAFLDSQANTNILVHMTTNGGDFRYGMAVFDSIIASPSPVIVLAYAHARSMSSMILQAADVRVLMPNTIFLVHYGTFAMADRVPAVLSNIEQEHKDCNRMLDVYLDRCLEAKAWKGLTRDTVKKAIITRLNEKQDWILSAEETIEHGFADGILGARGWETISKIRKRV